MISLREGLNEVNIQMTPLPKAQFSYVSNIRQQPWAGPYGTGIGIKFEVDIKNTSNIVGTCHPYAFIGMGLGTQPSVDMGIKTINPGQTVTFTGSWWAVLGPDEWWKAYYIQSEAGIISFETGLVKVSVEIPPRIQAGSEYWATVNIYLEYPTDPTRWQRDVYEVLVQLVPHDTRVWVPERTYTYRDPETGLYFTQTEPAHYDVATYITPYACAGGIALASVPAVLRAAILDHTGMYAIKGVWQMVPNPAGTDWINKQSPASTIAWYDWHPLKEVGERSGYFPILPGKYDVVAWLFISHYITWPKFPSGGERSTREVWKLKVDEVEVF